MAGEASAEFFDRLADQMNNLLTPLRLYMGVLERTPVSDRDLFDLCGEMLDAVDRAVALLRTLDELRAPGSRSREPVCMTSLVATAAADLCAHPSLRRICCRNTGELWVPGEPVRLAMLVRILCDNAVQAMTNGPGQLVLDLRPWQSDTGEPGVRLEITDDGTGIDDALLPHIFEPFVSTRPPSMGFGLGLPVAAAIVRAHDGSITARSTPASGTTLTVWLPRVLSCTPQ